MFVFEQGHNPQRIISLNVTVKSLNKPVFALRALHLVNAKFNVFALKTSRRGKGGKKKKDC